MYSIRLDWMDFGLACDEYAMNNSFRVFWYLNLTNSSAQFPPFSQNYGFSYNSPYSYHIRDYFEYKCFFIRHSISFRTQQHGITVLHNKNLWRCDLWNPKIFINGRLPTIFNPLIVCYLSRENHAVRLQ